MEISIQEDEKETTSSKQGKLFAKIDAQERKRKRDIRYQPTKPETLIATLNDINDNISLILVELRGLNNLLEYHTNDMNNILIEFKRLNALIEYIVKKAQ